MIPNNAGYPLLQAPSGAVPVKNDAGTGKACG